VLLLVAVRHKQAGAVSRIQQVGKQAKLYGIVHRGTCCLVRVTASSYVRYRDIRTALRQTREFVKKILAANVIILIIIKIVKRILHH
jgi:hypothetical protein